MNEAIIKISGEVGEVIDDIIIDVLEDLKSRGLIVEVQKETMICINCGNYTESHVSKKCKDCRKIKTKNKNNKIGMLYTGFGRDF